MLFKKKKNSNSEQSVSATLYPDQIIIVTKNKMNAFTWYSTDCISILPIDTSNLRLGEIIMKHLEVSKEQAITHDQIRILRENFRKAAKFKTEKAAMTDAKYVSIFLTNKEMRFEPYKNMFTKDGQKEFYRIPDSIFSFPVNNDYSCFGQQLRNAWESCLFA